MSNINTATYIKKLVKMVYEKQNQIEGLKKELRNINSGNCAGAFRENQEKLPMEETIKNQIYLTSTQLREVTLQMNAMESKMVELQLGLQEEIIKNNELQADILALRQQNSKLEEQKSTLQQQLDRHIEEKNNYADTILKNKKEFDEISLQVSSLFESLQAIRNSQNVLRQEKDELLQEMEKMRQREAKENLRIIDLERQFSIQKAELLSKNNQIELIQMDLQQKQKKLDAHNQQIQANRFQIEMLNQEVNQLKLSKNELCQQLQRKANENYNLNESLKDYEEFSFEISRYIESAFLKHCCQGHLRSSKVIIKENGYSIFEPTYQKMTQIQHWMDQTQKKLEKIIEQQEIPNQTLENLSIIVKSFEEKLELCDLTERLEKENDEFIKNEEEVINNLQKDCEKSYERQRSRIVELGQMKEVLKMTKEVNRQLLDQVNQRDCIIIQCKKIYQKCLPRNSQQFNLMKKILEQI